MEEEDRFGRSFILEGGDGCGLRRHPKSIVEIHVEDEYILTITYQTVSETCSAQAWQLAANLFSRSKSGSTVSKDPSPSPPTTRHPRPHPQYTPTPST